MFADKCMNNELFLFELSNSQNLSVNRPFSSLLVSFGDNLISHFFLISLTEVFYRKFSARIVQIFFLLINVSSFNLLKNLLLFSSQHSTICIAYLYLLFQLKLHMKLLHIFFRRSCSTNFLFNL